MRVEWMWQTNADSWSEPRPAEWGHYSDVENLIIEEAFATEKTHAILDGCHIDFKHWVQICNNGQNQAIPIQRLIHKKDEKYVRTERFMPDPIAPKRPYGGEYGWVSPFIIEVREDLKLSNGQLPSRDETIVPMVVEKAALGLIEEGKKIGKQQEATYMAEKLMKQQKGGINEVWQCCAYLYSMNSFLYQKLNETMRLIGSEEHEQEWRTLDQCQIKNALSSLFTNTTSDDDDDDDDGDYNDDFHFHDFFDGDHYYLDLLRRFDRDGKYRH
ncbi:unnamed protein product [Adineta steineri]|uniref:Uncharacterized protein n=1 Tax=Adineta steineri TaxID=433720 RepID=A0A813N238_9BILA|nr:unnamed protein product [Adineta steineri]CAF3624527.1 unnamed protein product [Adineta steineri]CAF4061671.1 unnamed protein product [Adineta steineri]